MTQYEREVIERLARMESEIGEIKGALERDRLILYGNDRPGLVNRVAALELNWRWVKWLAGIVGAGVGFLVSLFTKN